MDETRTVHSIPCEDATGRARALLIWGTPGRLSFLAPPGESAHVHPRDYESLRRALQDSLVEAYRERRPAAAGSTAESQPPQRDSAGAEDEHAGTAVPGSGTLGPHASSRSAES